MLLLSGMQCSLSRRNRVNRREQGFALGEPCKNRRPSGFDGPLKMNRLHAHDWKGTVTQQQASGTRTTGELGVFFQHAAQPGLFPALEARERDEFTVENLVGFGAQNISETTGHPGTEIPTERAENQNDAAGHVLAAVLADSLDDCERAAVANGEAFSGAARDEELAGCSAVQHGVSRENITTP